MKEYIGSIVTFKHWKLGVGEIKGKCISYEEAFKSNKNISKRALYIKTNPIIIGNNTYTLFNVTDLSRVVKMERGSERYKIV